MSSEIWKPIPNYEDSYEVSNLGRVRSIPRTISSGDKRQGKILIPHDNTNGYLFVALWRQNKSRQFLVHRLVMLAFCGEPPAGHEVHHIDFNRYNNSLDNLQYVTHSENNKASVKAGRLVPYVSKGEDHPDAKLTEQQVLEIRYLYTLGNHSQNDLAKIYSVSKPTIKDILKRRSWKHI